MVLRGETTLPACVRASIGTVDNECLLPSPLRLIEPSASVHSVDSIFAKRYRRACTAVHGRNPEIGIRVCGLSILPK